MILVGSLISTPYLCLYLDHSRAFSALINLLQMNTEFMKVYHMKFERSFLGVMGPYSPPPSPMFLGLVAYYTDLIPP
jgi:hypothetical protein